MTVELVLDDEYEFFDNRCSIVPTIFDLGVKVCIDNDYTLSDFLENNEELEKALTNEVEFSIEYEREPLFESIEKLSELQNNTSKVIDNIKWVRIAFSNSNIKEYIDSHPYLLNKNIILPTRLTITDYDKASKLLDEYHDYKNHIYVLMDNNSNYVKLEDAYNTILKVKKIAEDTLKLGMSPMEEVMYVYDQVRSRIYKKEEDLKDHYKSCDLTEVLNNDTIVCLGYANIFNAILNYLKIDNHIVSLSQTDGPFGHSRDIAYIKDDKYGIDGVYYFDPTFDSQKTNNSNNYLNTYRHFAKTKAEMDALDEGKYIDNKFEYYNLNMGEEVKEIFDTGDYEMLEKNNMVKSINYMSNIVNGSYLIGRMNLLPISPYYGQFDKNAILDGLDNILNKFQQPISAETYIDILRNVRKKEYYQDAVTYPYEAEDLYQTYRRSKWHFSKHYYSEKEKLLMEILGNKYKRNKEEEDTLDFIYYFQGEEGMNREMAEVKLTKSLNIFNKNRK